MAKILILEDNKESLMALEKIVAGIMEDTKVFGASTIDEAKQLIDSEENFSLFLLDINLNEKNIENIEGMSFAKEIRKHYDYELVPIVFITSILSLELTSYREIQCYRYITKPFHEEEVKEMIERILSHSQEEEKEFILIKKDGINYKILCEDILYIQAVPRGIRLFLKKEELEVKYLTLRQIYPKLPQKDFLQCHRMFIVNRKFIEYIDTVNKMIKILGKNESIEIGVTYKGKIREWMNG